MDLTLSLLNNCCVVSALKRHTVSINCYLSLSLTFAHESPTCGVVTSVLVVSALYLGSHSVNQYQPSEPSMPWVGMGGN